MQQCHNGHGKALPRRATNTDATSAASSARSSAQHGDTQRRPHSAPPEDRISRLESAVKSYIQAQQTREERQEREAQLQNQRWRSLHHHFQLLQKLVNTESLDRRSPEEEEDARLRSVAKPSSWLITEKVTSRQQRTQAGHSVTVSFLNS